MLYVMTMLHALSRSIPETEIYLYTAGPGAHEDTYCRETQKLAERNASTYKQVVTMGYGLRLTVELEMCQIGETYDPRLLYVLVLHAFQVVQLQ